MRRVTAAVQRPTQDAAALIPNRVTIMVYTVRVMTMVSIVRATTMAFIAQVMTMAFIVQAKSAMTTVFIGPGKSEMIAGCMRLVSRGMTNASTDLH
ncbi:hypothetical protein D3C72_1184450 [compost metagenome]